MKVSSSVIPQQFDSQVLELQFESRAEVKAFWKLFHTSEIVDLMKIYGIDSEDIRYKIEEMYSNEKFGGVGDTYFEL